MYYSCTEMYYKMAEILSMLYYTLVALFLLPALLAAYQVFSEAPQEAEAEAAPAPAPEPLDPVPARPQRKSRRAKARPVDDSSSGGSGSNPNPTEKNYAPKKSTSQSTESGSRFFYNDDRENRHPDRRRSRKERSASTDTLSHRKSQPRPEAYLTPYVDLSYEVGRDLSHFEPVYRRSASQRYTPPPDEEPADEPGVLTKKPMPEYLWFHTVRQSVLKHRRSDYLLYQGSTPLSIAYMLTIGWITLDECLSWAGGRAALGQGLLELAEHKERGIKLRLSPKATLPSTDELERDIECWTRIRCTRYCPYDWKADFEERKRYGPFGPAFEKLAPPGMLEAALRQIVEPAVDDESVFITENVIAVLEPLIMGVAGAQKGTEQKDDQEEREAAERARILEEALLYELESDSWDETAPPSDDGLITITDGSICTPPVPNPDFPHDSTSSTAPSTIASTPSVDYLSVLPPWQPVDASLIEFSGSGDSRTTLEDSDMEAVPQPLISGSLEPEFDMSSIPCVTCEEMDVEMIAVEVVEASMLMSIDSYIMPEPSIWYSAPQPAQMVVAAENTAMDAEMQETVQEVARVSMPRTFRPIPRTSSIEMQDVVSVPQGFPRPVQNVVPSFVSRPVRPPLQTPSVEMQDVSQSTQPAQDLVPREVRSMPQRAFRPSPQSSSSMTGVEMQGVTPDVREGCVAPALLQRNVPAIVVSSPKQIVASPPPMSGPSTSQVVAQPHVSATQQSGTVSNIPKPPVVPRRQRANALLVPSVADRAMEASSSSIQRDRPQPASTSAPVATQPVDDNLPDYEEEENEVPMSTRVQVVSPDFEEALTMPASPTIAPPPANSPPLEYVTTDLDAWLERQPPPTGTEAQDVLATIDDVQLRNFLAACCAANA